MMQRRYSNITIAFTLKYKIKQDFKISLREFSSKFSQVLLFDQLNLQRFASFHISTLHSFPRNYYSEDVKQQKVGGGPDVLYSKISNSESIEMLLRAIEEDLIVYKRDHVLLCLKTLSRLLKRSSTKENTKLSQDERYVRLTQRMLEYIEDLNEHGKNLQKDNDQEIMEFFFWVRRCRVENIPTNISEENLEKAYQSLRTFVSSNHYKFQHLVNLFYDLSFLNKNTNEIANMILKDLRTDIKLLTPFVAIQILQACASRGKGLTLRTYSLIDQIQKNYFRLQKNMSVEEKSHIFKYLANLELNLSPLRYKLPPSLFVIKNQLIDQFEQMNESSVLNVLDAYQDLPLEFPNDFINLLKDVVITTIQEGSENVKSYFILLFLDKMVKIRKTRRISTEQFLIIYEEIAKRVMNDEFFGRFNNLEKLTEIYQHNKLQYNVLIEKIYNKSKQIGYPFFSLHMYTAFLNSELDVTSLVDAFLSSDFSRNLGPVLKAKMFIFLSLMKNQKYQKLQEEYKQSVLSSYQNAIKAILGIFPIENYHDEAEEFYQQISFIIISNQEAVGLPTVFKCMFIMSVTSKLREQWSKYLIQIAPVLEGIHVQKLLDGFFELNEHYRFEQILLFKEALDYIKPGYIPFKKLIIDLGDDSRIFTYIQTNKRLMKDFIKLLVSLMEKHKDDFKLPIAFRLLKRIEEALGQSSLTNQLARKIYDIQSNLSLEFREAIDIAFYMDMMDKEILDPSKAQALYQMSREKKIDFAQEKMNDLLLITRVFAYSLPKQEVNISSVQIEEAAILIQTLDTKFISTKEPKKILEALTGILRFPPKIIKQQKLDLVALLQQNLPESSAMIFFDLIDAFQPEHIEGNEDFYEPLISILIKEYTPFSEKLWGSEILGIFEKFASMGLKDDEFYYKVFVGIAKHLLVFNPDQVSRFTVALARLSIKYTEFLDQILKMISDSPYDFIDEIRSIVLSLFRVGHVSSFAKKSIPAILNVLNPVKSSRLFSFACYIPILNLKNEEELLSQIIPKIVDSKYIPQGIAYILLQYIGVKYPKKREWAQTIEKVIKNIDEVKQNFEKNNFVKSQFAESIKQYLEVMGTEFLKDHEINGIRVDFYLPKQQENILQIILKECDINFDHHTYRGMALLQQKTYENLTPEKPIFINIIEFKSYSSQVNKAKYLKNLGIHGNVEENNFSKYQMKEIQYSEKKIFQEENEESIQKEDDEEPRK